MFYAQSPKKAGLPREILKWMQSLDLTFSPRHMERPRLQEDYMVCQIFSWWLIYHAELTICVFSRGSVLPFSNLYILSIFKFIATKSLKLPKEAIYGTMHCKPGAAEILVECIYSLLTNRQIKMLQDEEVDFTDRSYQEKLPMVVRATASKSVKNNIKATEIMADNDFLRNQKKAEAIISRHLRQRQQERLEEPKRFDIKPTLGELAVRFPTPSHLSQRLGEDRTMPEQKTETKLCVPPATSAICRKSGVPFREIQVKQTDRKSILSP
uniref:Spermatosis associated 4 n=1 Tax=Latimeria chalumnae TaxID=7897 RepID=H3ASK8_LATCH